MIQKTNSAHPRGGNRPSRPPMRRAPAPNRPGTVTNRPQRSAKSATADPKPLTSEHTIVRDTLRIIPIGGVEEVGANMTVFEYGNDIIVVDMGFAFPDETTPGIDYIIPDTQWLEQNKSRIRGVFITHVT